MIKSLRFISPGLGGDECIRKVFVADKITIISIIINTFSIKNNEEAS